MSKPWDPWDDFPDNTITGNPTTYFLAVYSPTNLTNNIDDLNIKLRNCDPGATPCEASAGTLTGPASICEGESVDLSLTGTSGTLGYVIFQNGVVIRSLSDLEEIEDFLSGADPDEYCVYIFAYTETPQCGNFTGFTLQEVIDACFDGQCFDVGQPVCITVNPNPEITDQPDDVVTCFGGSASFTVEATVADGATLSYQWQFLPDGGMNWNNFPNTTATLVLAGPLNMGANGNQYRVIVTSDSGTPDDTSDDCTVTAPLDQYRR